jgi:hypothetical protein
MFMIAILFAISKNETDGQQCGLKTAQTAVYENMQ